MPKAKLPSAGLLCFAIPLGIGCSGEAPSSPTEQAPIEPVVSWEEFLRFTEPTSRVVDGEKIYRVEWDIPMRESELHDYYVDRFVKTQKSTVDVLSDGVTDNKWTVPENLSLTYCISTGFGSNYSRVQAEMERATWAWTRAAGVRFIYLSGEDGNCVDSNAAVEIPVKPDSGGGACAFFPIQDGQAHCSSHGRALIIDIADIDSWPTQLIDGEFYPNITTEGTLRHELGHVLGLRHEHLREPDNDVYGVCGEASSPGFHRALTEYDVDSVMHYPWCDGLNSSDQSVTILDGQGASRLYGPPAWQVAVL
jgi:hypothetical protein